MGIRGLFWALGAAVLACVAIGSTPALASSADVSATQAYARADYALVHVARSHLASSEAGPLQVLAQVERECPGAGVHSPQNPESTQMSYEVIGAMVYSAAPPDRQAMNTFIRATAGLSWSNRALTHTIRGYIGDLKTFLSLPDPDLCADVRAWAASGFHALPASTSAYVAKFVPSWVSLGFVPGQLTAFESPAAKSLVRRARPLEQQLAEGEARAVAHYGDIMNALAIWP